ncbi:MAG TPA: transcriptional repressor, partial [Thermoleophilaceae bacterium]|nr:transcriptional repressor [Thermoleophilaceae bacterium]
TVDATRSYFDTRVDDHPHYYWEEDGRLTDAPVDAVQIGRPPLLPAGAELSRIDVVIRLRRKR